MPRSLLFATPFTPAAAAPRGAYDEPDRPTDGCRHCGTSAARCASLPGCRCCDACRTASDHTRSTR